MPRNHRDNTESLGGPFIISNHTTDGTMNCDSTSDGELADLVGEVVTQLIRQGILKGSVT